VVSSEANYLPTSATNPVQANFIAQPSVQLDSPRRTRWSLLACRRDGQARMHGLERRKLADSPDGKRHKFETGDGFAWPTGDSSV
jgi:hypothetical protein